MSAFGTAEKAASATRSGKSPISPAKAVFGGMGLPSASVV